MIRVALDLNKKRTFIENVDSTSTYYCEACGAKMIPKLGKVRVHHFAHKFEGNLTYEQRLCRKYENSNNMSDWHLKWQEKYPIECREVVKKNSKGEIHRADVCIENNKTIIEFQHTYLSSSDFFERNRFYNDLGYKVVWLYDFNEIAKKEIKYLWPDQESDIAKRHKKDKDAVYRMDKTLYTNLFGDYDLSLNKNVEVHFVKTQGKYTFYKKIDEVIFEFEDYSDLPEDIVDEIKEMREILDNDEDWCVEIITKNSSFGYM